MKFSSAERRGALIVLGILILIGAWQVRRYYLSQAGAAASPVPPSEACESASMIWQMRRAVVSTPRSAWVVGHTPNRPVAIQFGSPSSSSTM